MVPARVLSRDTWEARVQRHAEELGPIVEAHRSRRSLGTKHPVIDFLFEYYRFRPSSLLQWSPGVGVRLEDGASHFSGMKHVQGEGPDVWLSSDGLTSRLRESTGWILNLLEQTQDRPAMFGCSGLHEWAMVYRQTAWRHQQYSLRLPPEKIAAVVDEGPLVCTHYDAFRFFTAEARPLNRNQLTIESMPNLEQPGCLHTNMDLYRWASKRYPWIGSDLIREAFLLAMDIRAVDMRASPYDLSDLGYEPIAIETEAGRAAYRKLQEEFSQRARPLRQKLIEAFRQLLAGPAYV
ncbi:MAG: 3-methyladenine DNA glycosylase [Rhodothermales bacterium]|nr:3-methyladenine DNA glycosylase [Rhodothermales bacterium]